MSDKKYTFLMTGKTGVGKSALGNSILGHETFLSRDTCERVTTECALKVVNRQDLIISVVDTPGFMETGLSGDEAKFKALIDIKNAMTKCDTDGKLAVIFVIKYGERFTDENLKTLQILEHIFGKENIWESCVIVMTHGESFDLNNKTKSFQQYLKEAKKELGELFEKCNYRCVLFHNKTTNENKKTEQLELLIKYVKELNQGYTRNKFEAAKKEQNRLELESKISNYKIEFRQKLDKINTELENIELSHESLDNLKRIENKIVQNKTKIDDLDSPEIIYYEEDEERLLDDIRKAFESLHQLTFKKTQNVEQLIYKEEIKNRIDAISDEIQKFNHEATNAFDIIVELENTISCIDKSRQDKKLTNENNEQITLKIAFCQNQLERVKEKIIELKIQQFQKRLLEIKEENIHKEILMQLKEDCIKFKKELENDIIILRKDFLKIQKQYLLQIEETISRKKTGMLQIEKVDTFQKDIIAIENEIKNSQLAESEINKVVGRLDAKLNYMNEKIEAEISRLDLKTQLTNSIKTARLELENLERKFKHSKEIEIHNGVHEIKERVRNLQDDDTNFEEDLRKLERDFEILSNKIHLEKNEINENIFKGLIHKFSDIKSEIEKRWAQHEKFSLKKKFTKLLGQMQKEIIETDITDKKGHAYMETLNEHLHEMEQEINYAQLGEDNKIDLKAEIQNLKREIKDKVKKETLKTEDEIKDAIKNITLQIKETKYFHENATSVVSSLKKDLNFVKDSLDEINGTNLRQRLDRLIKKTEEEIKNLEKQIEEFEIFKKIKSKFEKIIPPIRETLQTTDSEFSDVSKYEENFKKLKKKAKKKITNNPFKEEISKEIFMAHEKIEILKRNLNDNQRNSLNSGIQSFEQKLLVIIDSNVNVSEQLHTLKEEINNFKSDVNKIIQNEFKKDILQKIELLLNRINNRFEHLRQSEDAENIIEEEYNLIIQRLSSVNLESETILSNISSFKKRLEEIKKMTDEKKFHKSYLHRIREYKERAIQKLIQIENDLNASNSEAIKIILEQLKTIDPTNLESNGLLAAIEIDLDNMKTRIEDSNTVFENCKKLHQKLKSRADIFFKLKGKFYLLSNKYKHNPDSEEKKKWEKEFKKLKEKIKQEVTDKTDKDKLLLLVEEELNRFPTVNGCLSS